VLAHGDSLAGVAKKMGDDIGATIVFKVAPLDTIYSPLQA
jgi:hypothetical protein